METLPLPTAQPATRGFDGNAERLTRSLIGKTLAYFLANEEVHLQRIRARLLSLLDERLPVGRAQNLRSACVLLQKNSAAFTREFRSALQSGVHNEMRQLVRQSSGLEPDAFGYKPQPESLGLSLVDVGEVERELLLGRVSQRFTAHYDTSLRSLTLRLGRLLGQDALSLEANPFRPGVFVGAFMLAWEHASLDDQATQDLVQSLDPRHSLDLFPLYAELDAVLLQFGVSAQPIHRVKKSDLSATGRPVSPVQNSSGLADAAFQTHDFQVPEHVLVEGGLSGPARLLLQSLGLLKDSVSAAGMVVGSVPVDSTAADADFLRHLGQLQAVEESLAQDFHACGPQEELNVLRQMRNSTQAHRAPELDRGALDTLTEVFDFVFAQGAIPAQMKSVIGRLQIPVLKAAMLERDFFISTGHPARRLVDTLALASIAWTPANGPGDALYSRTETTVQRVLNEFGEDTTVFGDLLMEFTEFLFETEQQLERRIEPVKEEALLGESLEQALAHADEVIDGRMRQASGSQPLASFLAPFLTGQWRQVMARAWLMRPDQPALWESALATMHQLIWSTQPKASVDERQQLVAVLPDLVRKLNAGLDAIGWGGDERATFTRLLIATHMAAIRAPKVVPANVADTKLLKEAAPADVQALAQRQTDQRAGVMDESDAIAKSLTCGLWFEVTLDKAPRQACRLSWVSPLRTRFLFTNREGQDAFVVNEREVAALLRDQRLIPIDTQPIVSRAMEQLLARADESQSA